MPMILTNPTTGTQTRQVQLAIANATHTYTHTRKLLYATDRALIERVSYSTPQMQSPQIRLSAGLATSDNKPE